MYPYARLGLHLWRARREGPLSIEDTGRIRTRVWLGDIDFFAEFNNGRYLTLMDLGRMHLAWRTGLIRVAHERNWAFFVAGASVRFRHRLPLLSKIVLGTRVIGHDDRWFYFHQVYSKGGRPCFSGLIRAGLKNEEGIVPVGKVLEAMGRPDWNPELPAWVRAWIQAEDGRPWPPEETG